MGATGISAVSDAGPLVHLAEINCLELLSVFDTLHIPDAVWTETVGRERVTESQILGLGNIKRYTLPQTDVTQFIHKNHLERLHFGERECLYLCHQDHIPVLLIDDLAVRQAAQNLRLTPVGSLGIVVKAYRIQKITLAEAEHYITELYKTSSLFVTKAVIELAITQLRKQTLPTP